MKVLISGATGLVGKQLVEYLINQNHEVNILTHSQSKATIFNHKKVKSFFWDTDEQIMDKACFARVDAIIHLAGATISKRWTKGYKKQIIDSRVNSTKLLFNAVRELPAHQIKHFICASAIGIYPDSLTEKYTESYHGHSDYFLADVVEKWEQTADFFESLHIKVTKLRTGLVLARAGGAFPLMVNPVKKYIGANFGSGKQIYSWIHIDDLVRMYAFVLMHELDGVFNAVASNPVTCAQLMQAIANQVGSKIWLPNIPSGLLKMAMGEMAHLVLDGQFVVNNKIKTHDFNFVYEDINTAVKSLV
ncbi:TIGR01777 family oxidoreductase [Flavobacterium agricola]|uniref:TIGR01777 family oxidoreductase n=1 Tax=Flavobacterium agricola TaxID=2870839 RepID=A0ABY6LVF0_9FLAO|nr:TIGR01777 family oxidoreductase [Flavobacterium agricola]UYW00304.1 TIGR01777 family oxidoreductase [Flavobacterium agricola]